MNKSEKFVVTINRELGSGGRTVGEKLAAKLNVPFYDKDLVKALEKEFRLTVEEIEHLKSKKDNWWNEFVRKALPFSDTSKSQYYTTGANGEPELITSEDLFKTEARLLEDIASGGSCVIAGRSGFHVFRNHPNHLSVLIQAPMKARINRLMRKRPISKEEAEKIIAEVDKGRENYVNKFTGTSRYDTRNYDLVINMEGLTEDQVVSIIMTFIG